MLLVGAGGFIGSVLRYLLSGAVQQYVKRLDFPFGILAVNVIGCFVMGLLAQFGESRGAFSNETRAFLFIGILGGFTTFSSFGSDTVNLFRQNLTVAAFVNIVANVLFGLLAVWFGRFFANLFATN